MKNLIFILTLALFLFSGCSKDNSKGSDQSLNVLTYKDITHQTTGAMLVFKGLINNSLCRYDLKIYSSNFTFNSANGEITAVNGTGKIITFNVLSSIKLTDVNADLLINSNDIILENLILDEGQYSLSSVNIAKTFEADFTIDATMSGLGTVHSIGSGYLNISRTSGIYEIKYNGMDEDGAVITGNFKDEVIVIRNQ
jgi:hypothetical protein